MRLSSKNREVAEQVLVYGKKARDISQAAGISPQAVSNIVQSVWRKFVTEQTTPESWSPFLTSELQTTATTHNHDEEIIHMTRMFEDMPGYVFWKNTKSIYMGCNKNLAQVFGLKSPVDIIGKTDDDFTWGKQTPEQIRQDDTAVMKTGERQISEFALSFTRSDGHPIWVRSEKIRYTNQENQVIGVMVVATDITDEKLLADKENPLPKFSESIKPSQQHIPPTERQSNAAKPRRKRGKEPEKRQDELDFAFDSNVAILADSPRWISKVLYVLLLFIIVGIIWAYFAQLDEVTVGTGKVIPSSEVQIIQNLEGGIVKKINVAEGDIVKKGQILLILDDTQFNALYKENLARKYVLEAMITRLQAQAEGSKTLQFSPELIQNHPDLVRRETNLFESHQQTLTDMVKSLQENYELISKEIELVKPAVQEGVVSKVEFFRLTRQANDLKRQINEMTDKNRRESLLELNQRKAEVTSLDESLHALRDRTERTVIRSPVEGVVNNLQVNTIGAVIKPGVDILEIVPLKGNLLIEARVKPADIAFIKVGQEAVIKFSAYDFSIYGGLPATVINISPSTIIDEEGNSYYEVKLRTKNNFLGTQKNPLPIIPGMTVTVHIITGEKSVLDYILKPLLKAKHSALQER